MVRRMLPALWGGLLFSGMVFADGGLDEWRSQAAAIRQLAENDIPKAYEAAVRLKTALPSDAMPADQARILNLLARIELYGAQTTRAAAHINKAREIAVRGGDRIGQIEAELNTALNAVNQGDIEAVVTAATHCMALFKGGEPPALLAEAMLRAAMTSRRLGHFDDSVATAMQAMELAAQAGVPLALTYAEQGLAISYYLSGHKEEARPHYERMRESAIASGSRLLEADATLGLGKIDFDVGNEAKGERQILQAIDIYQRVGGPFYVAHGKYGLADSLRGQGRQLEALALFNEVVDIHQRHKNPIGLWWALNTRSELLQALGRIDGSQEDATTGYRLAREIGINPYRSKSAMRLAELASVQGNFEDAYRWSREAVEMNERVEREGSSKRILVLAARFQNEAKQRLIDELVRNNEIRDAQHRFLLAVLLSSLLILAITVFFLFRLRRSSRLLNSAYDELRQVKEEQQAILDAIPDPLFDIGLDGRYHHCYSLHPELLTAPVEELIGKTVRDVMPAPAADCIMSAIQEANQYGCASGTQVELRVPEGQRWFELSISRKTGFPGETPRFVMLSRDITGRKQAERELTLLTHAVNGSSESIFLSDEQGRFVYVNDAACRLLGYSREELLALGPSDIDPSLMPEDEDWLRKAHIRSDLDGGLIESKHSTRGGLLFPVEISGSFVEYEGDSFTLAVVRDITERKRAQDAMAAQEREFRTLAENSPDMIMRYDRDCHCVYVNPACEREIAGRTDQVLNVASGAVWQDDISMSMDEYRAHLKRVIDSGEPADIVVSWWNPGGDGKANIRYHSLRIVAEYDAAGRVTGTLAIGRNISALMETEQRLAQSHTELQELVNSRELEREQERKHLARELHDDLGQYLTALNLNVSVLSIQFGSDNPILGQRFNQILHLLDQTKQTVRELSQRLRPAALNMGIDSALEWLVNEFRTHSGTRCQLELDVDMAGLSDELATTVFRVVQESLTNVARHADASDVAVLLRLESGSLLVEIRDDGRGFEPTQKRARSFGLIGMRERVAAVGGELEIVSAPARGTVIAVCIPAKEAGKYDGETVDCR